MVEVVEVVGGSVVGGSVVGGRVVGGAVTAAPVDRVDEAAAMAEPDVVVAADAPA